MKHAPWLLLLFAACGGTVGSTEGGGGDAIRSGSTGASSGGGSCPNDLPEGCQAPAPAWAKDVEPIVAARCATCHVTGGTAANRPLTTYAEVFSSRGPVLNQVHACKMPPAGAPPLSAAQRTALQRWLVCGATND
jgi:hypothetical protein